MFATPLLLGALLFACPTPIAAAATQDSADEQYQFLVGLCDKGLHEMVVKEAERFLSEHPRHAKATLARYRLADALFELDRAGDAAEQYRRLVTERGFEFRSESAFRLGQLELEAGRLDRAAQALETTLEGKKDYLLVPATFLLAETRFRQEAFEDAARRYEQVLDARPEPSEEYRRDARYGLAWCAFRRQDYDGGVERIRAFLRAYPEDELVPELRFLMGECHLEADRDEQALAAYRSVEGGPYADAAVRGEAFALVSLGRPAEAAEAFERLVRRFPDSRFVQEAALQRGIQLLEAGDARQARQALRAKEAGTTPVTLYWLARAESRTGDHEAALATLERALAAEPDDEWRDKIQIARGEELFALGRKEEAAAAYGSSGSDYALHAAAIASLDAGRVDDCVRDARLLIERFPDSEYLAQTRLALGEALMLGERYAEAEDAFAPLAAADARREDPARAARALARIGWCRYLRGEPAEAAEAFGRVHRGSPDAAEAEEARFMEARALQQAGREADAVKAFRHYLESHPEGAYASKSWLAVADLAQDEEGERALEALLSRHGASEEALAGRLELADRLLARGEVERAEPLYREFLAAQPDPAERPAARYGLAWCLGQRGAFDEGARVAEQAAEETTADHELHVPALELALWCRTRQGDARGALSVYRELIGATDDEARRLQAARSAALALQQAGEVQAAQGIVVELIGGLRDRAVLVEAHVEAANLALDAGAVDAAEQHVRLASAQVARDEAAPGALLSASFFVGEARFDEGALDKAAPLYRLVSAGDGHELADEALYKEGFVHLRLGDLDQARRCFADLAAQHAESELYGEALFLLGETCYRAGDFAAAVPPLRKLRAEVPRHETIPKALLRLGVSLARTGEWKEAESALTELVRKHKDFKHVAEAELWRGRALAARGDARGARSAFDRVVAADQGLLAAQARIEKGRLAFEAEDYERALSEFLKVAVLYSHEEEVAEALLLAGHCLEAQGKPEDAARQYREVLEKHAKTRSAAAAKARLEQLSR